MSKSTLFYSWYPVRFGVAIATENILKVFNFSWRPLNVSLTFVLSTSQFVGLCCTPVWESMALLRPFHGLAMYVQHHLMGDFHGNECMAMGHHSNATGLGTAMALLIHCRLPWPCSRDPLKYHSKAMVLSRPMETPWHPRQSQCTPHARSFMDGCGFTFVALSS